jgi:hypothetical protein
LKTTKAMVAELVELHLGGNTGVSSGACSAMT